jgi:hypothetical protein
MSILGNVFIEVILTSFRHHAIHFGDIIERNRCHPSTEIYWLFGVAIEGGHGSKGPGKTACKSAEMDQFEEGLHWSMAKKIKWEIFD